MKKRYIVKAPAKLNLHLEVGKPGSNGLHEIKSLFIMADIYDVISMSSLKTGNDCKIKGSFNCKTEDNLIYRAWTYFCEATGQKYGVEFSVDKKIPSFAGMGGGSSDAAAALKILNLMIQKPLGVSRLKEIGKRIGSDVPFFFESPAALISGSGETVKTVESPRVMNFVIVQPDIEISTADAYRWVDESGITKDGFKRSEDLKAVYYGQLSGFNKFNNDFTAVLCERYASFENIIRLLYENGAVYSNITGSGSAVYGLFESVKMAENAEKMLKNRYKFVQKIKSLDRIPNAILE